MNELEDMVKSAVEKVLAERADRLQDDDVDAFIDKMVPEIIEVVTSETEASFRRLAPRHLRRFHAINGGFRRRNLKRWKPALDSLEVIWAICEETGRSFNTENRPKAVEVGDYKFDALSRLHARALLIAREVICLLEGGFPDGALARWRSLHEVAVIACFIRQSDNDTAHRYLASFTFRARSAAYQFNKYAERANLTPYTPEELAAFDARCAAIEAITGRLMANGDYDWAAPAIDKNKKLTLLDLEEATGLDHWRPRYRWASQHTHAGHRPAQAMLAMAETDQELLLVGPSNSSFVDPIHMTAISLSVATSALLAMQPSLDHRVVMGVIAKFVDELGPLAQHVERSTKEKARRKKP